VLPPWAKLQAMLQGTLQAAGPVGCYYKVLTGRAGPHFLGVLFLDPRFGCFDAGRFVAGSSFLNPPS